jgi:hypothetical protein
LTSAQVFSVSGQLGAVAPVTRARNSFARSVAD